MRITQLLLLGLLSTALPVQFAVADADGERAVLARIMHELQVIEPLITEATSQANLDARIRFQYDWLRQDLSRIRTHDEVVVISIVFLGHGARGWQLAPVVFGDTDRKSGHLSAAAGRSAGLPAPLQHPGT